MRRMQISPYKQLRSLIEQERLHITFSRDKRIEMMRKLKPVELINCMECLLYKYEELFRVQNIFENYKLSVKKLTEEQDIFDAFDFDESQELWKEFLKRLSTLNLNVLKQEPDEEDELSSALKGWGSDEEEEKKKKGVLHGPINDIFYKHSVMLVYGTVAPEKSYREVLGERAYSFVNTISQNMRIKVPIKKDVDITGDDIKNYHLILFGGPGTNDLAEEVYDELPVACKSKSIELGDMKFSQEDTRIIMLSPNPLNPSKYLLLYNSLGFEGIMDLFGLYHGPTDFVLGNNLNWIARGFFDKSEEICWHYSSKDTEINKPLLDLINRKGWDSIDSKHYLFNFPIDSVPERDIADIIKLHEESYPLLLESTGLAPDRTVEVYLYETNDEKEAVTGARSDGSFEPFSPRLYLVYNDPIADYGPKKILHSLYRHIDWSEE